MVDRINEQYVKLIAFLTSAQEREEGQGLVEYALIISLVSIAIVAGLTGLKDAIAGTFTTIGGSL